MTATRERFLAAPRRALWVGGALLALVCLSALLVPTGPLRIDRAWSELMRDVQTAFLEHVALVFDALGRGLPRALSLVAVGLVLLAGRRFVALLAFAAAESLTPLASTVMKALVDRPRPPDGLVSPSGASFPSGHAAYAGVTSVALVLLFTAAGRGRRRWWALAALATLAMAWSRTYLQVHWLSDVVAGALLGIAFALLAFAGTELAATTGRRPSPAPSTSSRAESTTCRGSDTRRAAARARPR